MEAFQWLLIVFAVIGVIAAFVSSNVDYGLLREWRERLGERVDTHERRLNYHVASASEVGELRSEIRALAYALGYEWVPEGKAKAEWRRKAPEFGFHFPPRVTIIPAPEVCDACAERKCAESLDKLHAEIGGRRKGDRKKGGRK